MRRNILCLAAFVALLSAASAAVPQTRARSVHLHHFPVAPGATALQGTVQVEVSQTNSYFCIINCDRAYCGIQELKDRRIFIFSVWEPGDYNDSRARAAAIPLEMRVKTLFAAEGTEVSRFGGEGTGAKTITDIGWKVGESVSARIETEPDGDDRTAFSCFVKVGDGEWKLLAKLATLGVQKPLDGFASFVEDFWRTTESAQLVRKATFSGFASRSAGAKEWIPADAVKFTADNLKAHNIDAGKVSEGAFFLQTGGETRNTGIPLWGEAR